MASEAATSRVMVLPVSVLTKIFGVRRDDKNNMKLDQTWRIIIATFPVYGHLPAW